MPSEVRYEEAYVWIWLPGRATPVVAGLLSRGDGSLVFNYGQSYLARPDAIPIYEPELPLRPGILPLLNGLSMPNAIRDASPDAWGRRVIINRTLGLKGQKAAPATTPNARGSVRGASRKSLLPGNWSHGQGWSSPGSTS